MRDTQVKYYYCFFHKILHVALIKQQFRSRNTPSKESTSFSFSFENFHGINVS